ncbi:AraC family transcriptional regulator [Jiella pacifica]|uniref:Helix-turn-helix domain-containing protein n=1 Tax=Jiella pacifica TaxID=2696469 RepID=A0A6N9T1J4_9HYPH|nr:helix-turn-helix transcriptional regulator [Jiella pacifica]NDW03769.1 helix-turn-helix domain-containing protein [Jiella pacifica]
MIFKSGQSAEALPPCAQDIDFNRFGGPAMALRVGFGDDDTKVPEHRHAQGQLILALHGAVTCTAVGGLWLVPSGSAVWIPGGVPHSNQATHNARLIYLFVEPSESDLPPTCRSVSVSPMLREMILRLADVDHAAPDERTSRLMRVLLDELALMPNGGPVLPLTDHPKIALIAAALAADPADRRTLGEWARHVAVSERSLKRLMVKETGLTFSHWRRQLHLIIAVRELAGGATVQKVSGDLGYESVTAFIVMFKKALGVTPSRYRPHADLGSRQTA